MEDITEDDDIEILIIEQILKGIIEEKNYVKNPTTKTDFKNNLELIMLHNKETELDEFSSVENSIMFLRNEIYRLAEIVDKLVDKI